MGSHVAEEIEDIMHCAAACAVFRPRKRDIAELIRRWRLIEGCLPQESRSDAVREAIVRVEFHGPVVARAFFEALQRYGLWYEGYSFGR